MAASAGVEILPFDGAERFALGEQDLVILALKAHQVEAVARDVPQLFGPDTAVVTMQNGIPYWYFHRHGGEFEGLIKFAFPEASRMQRHGDEEPLIGGGQPFISGGPVQRGGQQATERFAEP